MDLPQSFIAYKGGNIMMTVSVVKSNPPVLPNNITWSTDNIDDDRVNISEDGRSLHISDVTSKDEGYYQVIIWHPAGQRNKTTYLKVAEGIIVYLLNAIIFIEGQFNVLSVSVGLSLGMILVISLIIFGLTFIIVKRKKKQIEVDSLEAYRQNQ